MKGAAAARSSRAGITLLELLLVMGLLATVFGAGLGLFAALDLEQRQAAGVVKEALRTARESALSRQAPARVRVDAAAGTLEPMRLLVIGTWAFERGDVPGQVEGAFGLDGAATGGTWVEDGWIGDALSLAGDGLVEIPVQDEPDWDLRDGFRIELALRRDDTGGGRLLRLGGAVGLDVGAAGGVRAWFTPVLEEEGDVPRAAGRVQIESDPAVVPPGRWVRLVLAYDRRTLTLIADGVPRVELEETRPVWTIDDFLVLSDEDRPFPGTVDSLVVSAMAVDQPLRLPESVRLEGAPPEVRFGPDGALERGAHDGPVELTLVFEGGTRETITVGVYGTIE